ncbi:DivIVA domain-containing protein [Actinoplanes sp. GCM10030250]|uniref:DivIVA domain-containing protein n=1 Tax=Actinoplanes sp. GCM10030250 TaxID=3273376 RepID=UPI003619D975
MPLTPADVDNVEFRSPPAGSRGYDDSDVDAFLDAVADEMRRLTAENQALSAKAGRLEFAGRTDPAGRSGALNSGVAEREELAERLQRLQESCARAERDARAMRAKLEQARAAAAAAEPPPAIGGPGIAGVLELAQRTADEHLAEAQHEAETVLRQATTKADQLTSDAELRASTLVADARHNHAERIAGIAEKRVAALEEIADLGRFAQHYRAGLSGLLNERLTELTGKPRPDKQLGSEPPAARSA